MKYIMTEEEAIYMQTYQGHFSRKLAAWAISNMEMKDPATGTMKRVSIRSADDVSEILRANGVKIPEESRYDSWYVFMMSVADYPKTLTTDEMRSSYVEETICDPDGNSGDVLACFSAKMCNAGIPIHWEMFI